MKVFNKEIYNFFIKLYLLIMSVAILAIFMYFRLICKRNSYELDKLVNNYTLQFIIISSSVVIIHCILFIKSILNLLIIFKMINKFNANYKSFELINSIGNWLIWFPLQFLHDLIAPDLPGSGRLIMYYQYIFKTKSLLTLKFFFFFLNYFPKIIFATLFFIDIVIFNQVFLIVKIMPILIVPVLFQTFHKFAKSFYDRNFLQFDNVLEVSVENYEQVFKKKDIEMSEDNFNYAKQSWIDLNNLANINFLIDFMQIFMTPLVTLYCSFFLLTGSLYRLLFILSII